MTPNNQPRTSRFKRMVRKFSVSAFVVFTFITYAIHERLDGSQSAASASAPTPALQAPEQAQASPAAPPATEGAVAIAPTAPPAIPTAPPTEVPSAVPTPAPTTAAQPLGQYKDGNYTGAEVDAYYGLVRVQATIKQGVLADVQFLEYPNDRRTSIRINNIAMPYLQQEAIQAQSANVDIISGATLTSQAFAESLQVALNSAKTKA